VKKVDLPVTPAVPPLVSLPAPPALILEGVNAGYGRKTVLRDVDLTVPQGASWAVLGPSGGGKTTLLKIVLGQLAPRSGRVERPCLDGLNGESRSAIGYIPQNLGLVRNLTVRENVLLGALGRLRGWRSLLGFFPAAEVDAAEAALESVGLGGRGGDRIEILSGGQRRRVAIARALLQRPRLLLADEFLAELDPVTTREIVDLLTELRRATGVTILFVDHDVETAVRIADRIMVLVDGRKVCEVDPSEANAPLLCDLFRVPRLVAT